jgi:hypothetical protein
VTYDPRGAERSQRTDGATPVTFPSNHGGSLGGEYGQTGDPDAFAANLREVLDAQDPTATAGRSVNSARAGYLASLEVSTRRDGQQVVWISAPTAAPSSTRAL